MWFGGQRALKIHLRSCCEHPIGTVEGDTVSHHSLRSFSTIGCQTIQNLERESDDEVVYEHHYSSDSDHCNSFDNDNDHEGTTLFPNNHCRTTAVTKVQIILNDLINKYKAPLKLYDDIIEVINGYVISPNFDKHARLKSRKAFITSMEKTFNTSALMPQNQSVTLHDDSVATVPVFNAKEMILDLLSSEKCMHPSNIAEGYDIFTGNVDDKVPSNERYGEVHTGDAWIKARDHYCHSSTAELPVMPVALIVFGDKSHTDLHGALSLTPVIFTLTLFNRSSRNNADFWRPLGYIPNLGYGKNSANRTETRLKVQDEHTCLSVTFQSLRDINRDGGFKAIVMGKEVHVVVWIHFFIGDTEGNNKWLAHYPGNKREVSRPYRDCHCDYHQLSNPNPSCTYTTLDDMQEAKRIKLRDEKEGTVHYKNISRYDVHNALTEKHLPLSDQIHGPYRMMPPELLHTSGSGLIKYMFESLRVQIGNGKDRDHLDKLHIRISNNITHQSERDFPRGALRNGLIDGTKCQSEERKGNLFRLMCIGHTTEGGEIIKHGMGYSDLQLKKLLKFLQMYLAMEEWMHDCNYKAEVRNSRHLVAKVLVMLKDIFPRQDNTNGYNIPKFHGMTKFQDYITLYGSAMNFFGGPGEASHKIFVKAPGQKTQRRVSEFAVQTAKQYYSIMVTNRAMISVDNSNQNIVQAGKEIREEMFNDENIKFSGKYQVIMTVDKIKQLGVDNILNVVWSDDDKVKQGSKKYTLHPELIRVIHKKLDTLVSGRDLGGQVTVTGYTRATSINEDGTKTIFYAHPCYQGRQWYDWVYVHYTENTSSGDEVECYYPSKILGFITINGISEAVIQCSDQPLHWNTVKENFCVKFKLGCDRNYSFDTVPVSSLVHPLCVIPDYGGATNNYMVILPKRNWSRYFGDKV